jgi:THAP domain
MNSKTKCVVCDYCRQYKNSDNLVEHRELFQFPPKNDKRYTEWLTRMKLSENIMNDKAVICSYHFDESCFSKSSLIRRYLQPSAIPSLFPKEDNVRIKTEKLTGHVCMKLYSFFRLW